LFSNKHKNICIRICTRSLIELSFYQYHHPAHILIVSLLNKFLSFDEKCLLLFLLNNSLALTSTSEAIIIILALSNMKIFAPPYFSKLFKLFFISCAAVRDVLRFLPLHNNNIFILSGATRMFFFFPFSST
jgi:hypothetical protein